jgi:lysophospholipase L1-like esterase
MKQSTIIAIALLLPEAACGASGSGASGPPSDRDSGSLGSPSGQDANGTPGPMAQDSGDALDASSSRGDTAPAETGAADGAGAGSVGMPRISGGVPAFASGSADRAAAGPDKANDDDPSTSWVPDKLPAWIAYDLSAVPVGLRQSLLVVWNAPHAAGYINASPPAGGDMPTDYTIETNAAPGGGAAPPTSGWVQVTSVQGNLHDTVEQPATLGGGNWVRMSITGSSDATVAMDLDVYSAPNGASDAWMFMGDSITFITMPYPSNDLPRLVRNAKADRWPAVINAAIGGTSAMSAISVIDDTMSGFPGRYVVLAYGTNDLPNEFGGNLETLVQKVLTAGKIPVVPHMPWSSSSNILTNGPQMNQQIDALYTKYPQILRGPDLWAAFLNRTDLIPSPDVHPNSAGQEFLRQQWAQVMSAVP